MNIKPLGHKYVFVPFKHLMVHFEAEKSNKKT